MDMIKKTGIIAGAVAGGLVGGSISLIGKLSNVKIIDDIGSSITSSMVLTGELAGGIASGAVDAVSGGATKNPAKTKAGLDDLKQGGKQIVNNVVTNVNYIVENRKDPKQLAKIIAVGAITVGAIKMTDSKKPDEK